MINRIFFQFNCYVVNTFTFHEFYFYFYFYFNFTFKTWTYSISSSRHTIPNSGENKHRPLISNSF